MVVAPNMTIIYAIPIRPHLFQSLLPAVGLITEGALELLGHGAAAQVAGAPLDVPLAHLLLQVLLQAGLVGKFARTVWTLERPINSVVSCLEVIVEKSLLSKILIAVLAYKRAFSCMNPVVNIKM